MAKRTGFPAVIVHGGAGRFDADRQQGAVEACRRAAVIGLTTMKEGGSALDAVHRATRVLEDDPNLNAGTGASLNRAGEVEVDAALMDGQTLALGAVASMRNCAAPIDVARLVLDDGRHCMLCGEGAWAFARARGVEPAERNALALPYREEQLASWRRKDSSWTGDTVGACASDGRGHSAAASSTGGTTGKLPGRIGDSPLVGSGLYADDSGAATATGHGESLMRMTGCRDVTIEIARGKTATQASADVVARIGGRFHRDVGIISVDADGRIGAAHNTTEMPFAAGVVVGGAVEIIACGIRIEPDFSFDAAIAPYVARLPTRS